MILDRMVHRHRNQSVRLAPAFIATCALLSCVAGACKKQPSNDQSPAGTTSGHEHSHDTKAGMVNPTHFLASSLVAPIKEVPCTLSNGRAATCYSIQAKGTPDNHAVGPWCPRNITDGPEAGGIWPEAGVAHDVTGEFVRNLGTLYQDPSWKIHNPDGTLNVTDTAAECAGAARPDVDPALQHHCVQCLPSYLDAANTQTTIIPKTPQPATQPGSLRGNVGVALNGVEFANSAPTHAILAAHTLAPFDDCGGHINMHEGYHYHAVTKGCLSEIATDTAHAPLIGYAMDGYGIYAADTTNATAVKRDRCGGHSDNTRGYHYHAADAGKNQIIGCFMGAVPTTKNGGRGGPPNGGPPNGGPPTTKTASACRSGQTERCCGDQTCDGPETPANCPADCR